MIPVPLAILLVGGAFVAGVAVAFALVGVRTRRVVDRLLPDVDPYLRRKAAEAGLEVAHPTWNARTPPDQIATHVAELAEQLLRRERRGQPPGPSDTLGLAETQPVATDAKKD